MFQDFKFILQKPLLIVSLLVISLLPVIYTVTFLGAMWNPYDRTDDMQFHIVNEDTGNKDINLGTDIVDELKNNKQLDWQFTDLNEAEESLQKGDSYGYIQIPADASDNAMTFLTDTPQNVKLKLTTNPGHNFIGSIMSEQAGAVIADSVQKQITKAYTETLISELDNITDQSDEAAYAVKELASGAAALDNGLEALAESSVRLNDGSENLANGALQANNAAGTLYSGEQQFTGQLNQLTPMLGNYGEPLTRAQSQLENGASQLNDAGSELARGAGELNGGMIQMTNGINDAKEGSAELSAALTELDNRVSELLVKFEEQNLVFSQEGAELIAEPVNLEIESTINTQNYAQSFAPLILAVSLFIGALTLNVVYPMNKIFAEKTSVLSQWISRGLLFISHAFIITTLLYAVTIWGMQIEIASHWRFYLIMFTWSLVSITIIGSLVMMFGNFGKFLGIVLLIVQLSSSGGTFPIETAGNVYQSLYNVLPMAFTVTGFKEAIFGQAFSMQFSTVIYILTSVAAAVYVLILLILLMKDKFPGYKEKANKLAQFEN